MTDTFFATTNPGKFKMVVDIFAHHGLKIQNPTSLGITLDIDEVGTTLEENARLKVEAYQNLLPPHSIIIGDDTGVEIDALGGEPGIKVRRWKGHSMDDEEIINYCLERLRGVPIGKRQAQFRTVLAVAKKGSPIQYFDGILRGEILESAHSERAIGMPFWPIFYIPALKMTLGEFHAMPLKFQLKNPTHRELAVLKALPYLATLSK